MKATVKLSWYQPGPFVVLEADPLTEETGIELVPEVVHTRMYLPIGGRILVSVRDTTSQLVCLKSRMVLGKVNVVTPVTVDDLVSADIGKGLCVQSPDLSPRWRERG